MYTPLHNLDNAMHSMLWSLGANEVFKIHKETCYQVL